jgi:4-hydroxybenzoyl-CoA reductase subunit beta
MKLKEFEALRPTSGEEARSLLRKHGKKAAVKAGGTALIPEMKLGLKEPEYVITLGSVEGLDRIDAGADGLRIGAAASLHDVANSDAVKEKYPALADAIALVSAPSLHFQSTIGGNLCQNTRCQFYNQSEFWRGIAQPCFKRDGDTCHAAPGAKRCGSVYQGDLAAVLICMGAEVKVVSPRSERTVPVERLFTGRGESPLRLRPSELLTEIFIPAPDGRTFAYEKLRSRNSVDYPLLGVAMSLRMDGGECSECTFVVTAAGPGPIVVPGASLTSRPLDDALVEDAAELVHRKVRPIGNQPSTPRYRRDMAKVMVRRLIRGVTK